MTDQASIRWTSDTILEFLSTQSELLHAMGVIRIGLFGSYVRGEQHPESDIDILLTIENWTWKRWAAIWDFLENSFELKVDLVPEADLRPEIERNILAVVRYATLD